MIVLLLYGVVPCLIRAYTPELKQPSYSVEDCERLRLFLLCLLCRIENNLFANSARTVIPSLDNPVIKII